MPRDHESPEPAEPGERDAPAPTRNPLSIDVVALAPERLEKISRRFRVTDRCGGEKYQRRAVERLTNLSDKVETHVDDDALPNAATATARALLFIERAAKEHEDANAGDTTLDRAHAHLVEALMLLECVTDTNTHGERIRHARAKAIDKANEPPPGTL